MELRKDKEDILPRDEAVREETREQTSAAPLSRKAGLGGRRLRALLAFVVLAAVVMLGWPWLAERWSHVSINDARIAANLVAVSSEVSGRVSSISVIAGDQVEKGQLLARIDEEQTLLELQALDAQVTGIEAQQEQLRSQQAMIRTQVAAKLAAGRTEIKAAEANHRASEATLRNARSRFERVSSLARSNVSSAQSLEEAQAALTTAEQQEQATAAGIETALANLDVIRSEEVQIAVLDR
ncbi:MAG: biotin/lipoyl-binding protein [Alphaproteobacteria bacterium]|nr:biotin/lipoyl-binding protein [Alphaproteobacteria bacterium]